MNSTHFEGSTEDVLRGKLDKLHGWLKRWSSSARAKRREPLMFVYLDEIEKALNGVSPPRKR